MKTLLSNSKNKRRQKVAASYPYPILGGVEGKGKKKRGGVKYPFPIRLHNLLQIAVKNPSLQSLISWNEDGTCFRVHDKKAFERKVQSTYFNQSKYASFRRQLNLWAFDRVEKYRDGSRGDFYAHPLFKRDEPDLCHLMERSNHTNSSTSSSRSNSSVDDLRNDFKMAQASSDFSNPPLLLSASSSRDDLLYSNPTSDTTHSIREQKQETSCLKNLREVFQQAMYEKEKKDDTKSTITSPVTVDGSKDISYNHGLKRSKSSKIVCNISKEQADLMLRLLD